MAPPKRAAKSEKAQDDAHEDPWVQAFLFYGLGECADVEWIRRRETLECEVCNQTFLDVAVETRNVRVFSVMGPAYACLATQGGFVMFLWTV